MAGLDRVIGALISQIDRGRSQADMASVEVAQIYKEHPLLSSFPVPSMGLDEVVVELKMAIAEAPGRKGVLPREARTKALSELGRLVSAVIETEEPLAAAHRRYPGLGVAWESAHDRVMRKLSEVLPSETEVDSTCAAAAAASVIAAEVARTIMAPGARVAMATARELLAKHIPEIEERLVPRIEESIAQAVISQPVVGERVEVLVTASDLQPIPPEKITTVRLTLRESDRVWTQIETEDGEAKVKLVPS
jgi:hypothetical protein